MNINILVTKFRKAIEKAKNSENSEFFRKFPTGQCGYTCDLLSEYLHENGYTEISYVCGSYYGKSFDELQSHAWLEVNGIVIDITSDQFKFHCEPIKNNIPVYVGPITNYYRKVFEVDERDYHKHFGLCEEWTNYSELKTDYMAIMKYL